MTYEMENKNMVQISDYYTHDRKEPLIMKCYSTQICPLCKHLGGCKSTSANGLKLIIKLLEKENIHVIVE